MEEACQISSYLPLCYKNGEEEYIQYLWKAFENNYENKQYQFAFMSYHMLFMCFIYFTIWKIKSVHPNDFNKISLGFDDCMQKSSSPFGYSKEKESKIMVLLRFWGIKPERIGEYKKLVQERNNIAHSNGNIFYKSQQSIDDKVTNILRFCKEIQHNTNKTVLQSYKSFLIKNNSVEDSPYSTVEEMLNEKYIREYYISEKDMSICCDCNITPLALKKNFMAIKNIHNSIIKLYKEE